MKNKIFILLAVIIVAFTFTENAYADEVKLPDAPSSTKTGGSATPSESFLSSEKRSIGTSEDVQTFAAPMRGIARASDGWDGVFLPGEDWEIGDSGNVGYPIGDASLPILLSMLIIYFVYRSVSTSKRKNNF